MATSSGRALPVPSLLPEPLVRGRLGRADVVEGGGPFQGCSPPSTDVLRWPLRLLPNHPGGGERLKQDDARGGGKVNAADFALDGDADVMRRERDHFRRQP